jgi:hypothetical protein
MGNLFCIIGYDLFQLQPILGGASTTDKKTFPSLSLKGGTRAIAKGGTAAKKVKEKGTSEKTRKVEVAPYVEMLAKEMAGSVETTSTTTTITLLLLLQEKKAPGKKATAAPAKKQAPKKKKKVKANNLASLSKTEEQQQPDLVSIDRESNKTAAPWNIPIHTELAEEDGDWQTVTKSGNAELVAPPSQAKEKEQEALVEDPMPELTEETHKEPIATKSKTANGSSVTEPKPAKEKVAAFTPSPGLGTNSLIPLLTLNQSNPARRKSRSHCPSQLKSQSSTPQKTTKLLLLSLKWGKRTLLKAKTTIPMRWFGRRCPQKRKRNQDGLKKLCLVPRHATARRTHQQDTRIDILTPYCNCKE